MAWTTPKTWTVGEVLTAAGLNTHLRDNLNALRLKSIAQGNRNSGTLGAATLSTLVADELGGWGASADYFTAPYTGTFRVAVAGYWSGASGTGSFAVNIARKNSAGVLQENVGGQSSSVLNGMVNAATLVECAAGDHVEFQSSNSATGAAGSVFVRATVQAAG